MLTLSRLGADALAPDAGLAPTRSAYTPPPVCRPEVDGPSVVYGIRNPNTGETRCVAKCPTGWTTVRSSAGSYCKPSSITCPSGQELVTNHTNWSRYCQPVRASQLPGTAPTATEPTSTPTGPTSSTPTQTAPTAMEPFVTPTDVLPKSKRNLVIAGGVALVGLTGLIFLLRR